MYASYKEVLLKTSQQWASCWSTCKEVNSLHEPYYARSCMHICIARKCIQALSPPLAAYTQLQYNAYMPRRDALYYVAMKTAKYANK